MPGLLLGLLVSSSAAVGFIPLSTQATTPLEKVLSKAFEPPSHPSLQRTRGYFALRYGLTFFTDTDIASGLKIGDEPGTELFSASIGLNWQRYLGLEVAADLYESNINLPEGSKVGEYTVYDIIPQVRLRYPLLDDKLTPYLIVGAGLGFTEDSDRTPLGAGLGANPAVPLFTAGDTSIVYSLGGGLEYFIADNLAVGLETKYIAHNAEVKVNGVITETELDAFLVSAGLRLFFPGPPKLALAPAHSATSKWWGFDQKEVRPYFAFRVGGASILDNQITPAFELGEKERSQVIDLSLGFNLNRYLGLEVTTDQYGSDVVAIKAGKVGEYDSWTIVPQVRIRYPLMGDRLYPYLLAGIGVGLTEFNDRTPLGANQPEVARFNANNLSIVGIIGAGIEYFVAYNMAVGVESKYLFHTPEVEIERVSTEFSLDSILLTVGLRVFYP